MCLALAVAWQNIYVPAAASPRREACVRRSLYRRHERISAKRLFRLKRTYQRRENKTALRLAHTIASYSQLYHRTCARWRRHRHASNSCREGGIDEHDEARRRATSCHAVNEENRRWLSRCALMKMAGVCLVNNVSFILECGGLVAAEISQ